MAASLSSPSPASVAAPRVAGTGHGRIIGVGIAACALLCVVGLFVPRWVTFLLTMAAANGLV
jgi:hypothetical protein